MDECEEFLFVLYNYVTCANVLLINSNYYITDEIIEVLECLNVC